MELILLYAGACLCYAVYLYFNFSGYMDVVIGIGRLFGFSLPENFDRPFSSTSFLEFWSRWHITLSEWFKFYVFNPLLKTLTYRWDNPGSAPYLGVIAFFVVFLLMGIWHGSSYSFLLYGLFLGAGVSLNKLYEVEMRRRFGKAFYRSLGAHPLYGAFGGALTFAYWSMALTCFWMDYRHILELFQRLGFVGTAGVFAVSTVSVLIIMAVYAFGHRMWLRVMAGITRLSDNYFVQQGFLAAKAAVILLLIKMNAAPEFVYKAF
jgi:D-alanyl-lipoteichoic acid acyltransferase DltB (MBOAT superfamily)